MGFICLHFRCSKLKLTVVAKIRVYQLPVVRHAGCGTDYFDIFPGLA